MEQAIQKEEGRFSMICPVCEMKLEGVEQVFSEEAMGEQINFCSKACQEEYLKDPEKYLKREEEGEEENE